MLESAFNKGLVSNFIKKRLEHWFSPANIAEFLRSPVLKNICKWRIVSDIILHNLFFENSNFRTKISRKVRGKLPPPPKKKNLPSNFNPNHNSNSNSNQGAIFLKAIVQTPWKKSQKLWISKICILQFSFI